jgi:dipeptidyl aminopeptidase/acylaminoacyl peptidase
VRYIVLFGLLLLVNAISAEEMTNFSVQDLVTMKRISDPQASPDGEQIAFVVRRTDLEADKGRTSIWLMDIDGGNARQFTSDSAAHFQPRWSADGRFLYFISSRSGSAQLWRLPITGGEASQVTDFPLDLNTFVLSPTGDRLVVSMDVFIDCANLECTNERMDREGSDKISAQQYSQLFIRHWDTWKDHRHSVLFSLQLDVETGRSTGDPVPLSSSLKADVPAKPFSGPEEINISNDGRFVFFSARNAPGSSQAWSTNFDLYRAPIDGSSVPENLTTENPAWDSHPLVSPDGRKLAYLAMERAGFEADRVRIIVLDLASGERRVLTQDWDRSVSSMAWSPDGRSLYVTAQHVGNKPLWQVDLRSGEAEILATDGSVSGFTVAGRHIVFARSDLRSPAELYRVENNGRKQIKLTGLNDAVLEGIRRGDYEQFSFAGWNNETVYGYVVKPAEFNPDQQYPLAFLIHGGPQGSFGNSFHYRWNPQTYVGQNFAAVMIDFHGSTGYGQAFTDSISEDWGGKPLEDLKKGLAAALDNYEWIDGERACALGASYGGYMVNWIEGNWPDRFRCLVNHDGVFDNRMMYYSTEELWFEEWDQGGPHYKQPGNYEAFNPVNFVTEWKTPMLVIHGALDYRIPYTHGIAAFTALQRKGIESEFLFFPDENHWVLKPHNSIHWHEQVNAWLHRWLDGE